MPVDLVLVRHGRSEGNEAREQSKRGRAVARVQRLIPGQPVDLAVDA
ncbi:MAG: hypothetical protein M3370_11185 [Actinomycetota bacterium]|nr:hypothetical protein [Actinomycetota bacterium]